MRMTIYHNPQCSKSRKTLELLEENGVTPSIVEYLSNPPDADTLLAIAKMLGVSLTELLRRKDKAFLEAGNSVPMNDESALARWVHDHPSVLERPIVVDDATGRAVVGRPPDNVLRLLNDD